MSAYQITVPGAKFGRLTAISKTASDQSHKSRWIYQCSCGSIKEIDEHVVKSGASKSCGCLRKELPSAKTHGLSNTAEYRIWSGMRNRCENPNNASYKDYGARGITVCDEWTNSFECFLREMGKRPSKRHSIDRKRNDLGYSKKNCHWATPKEQADNTRRNVYLEYLGKKANISQWAKITGLSYGTIYRRKTRLNWSDEKTPTTP